MGAPEVAQTLPQWAVYALAGLSTLVGLFGAFVLGLIAYAVKQRRGAGASSEPVDDGDRRDCDSCHQMSLAREEFKAIWEEIKTSRSEMTSRLDNLFTLLSKQ